MWKIVNETPSFVSERKTTTAITFAAFAYSHTILNLLSMLFILIFLSFMNFFYLCYY